MTDNRDPYGDMLENQRKLEAWEARKKAEAEQKDREQKRDQLQRHLDARAKAWLDHTGAAPTTAVLERWTAEYLDSLEIEAEAEREARLAAAADQPHYHPES